MRKDIYQFVLIATAASLCAVALYFIAIFSLWLFSGDKIYPGVKVAGLEVSGKTQAEAKSFLNEKIANYQKENLSLITDKTVEVPISELALTCDIKKAVDDAYALGHDNPFFLGRHTNIALNCNYDFEKILTASKFQNTKAENAQIQKSGEDLIFKVGKNGQRLNYAELAFRANEAFGNFKNEITLPLFTVEPIFSEADFNSGKSEILAKTAAGFNLVDGSNIYPIDSGTLISWVGLSMSGQGQARYYAADFLFDAFWGASSPSVFSFDAVSNYLKTFSTKINTEPQNAVLGSKNGKVIVLTPEKEGRNLNVAKTANATLDFLDLRSPKETNVNLAIDSTEATVRSDNLAEIGLSDLISVGYSGFTGSPANRQHNIRTGASKFNGVIIKPDESFSFIETLGPVDASTGYLPELVIKENKTIPEYGGGMCQVSSTAYRAALNAGLPILERTPHSYPVSYYKPYGVDATVYIPKPDLVFKNDTGKYILVQTKIEGTKLSFEFYGTKPNRTVKFAGNENAAEAVEIVEKVNPLIYDQGVRGNGSFTAVVWRFIYDNAGKLAGSSRFISKYDSPDKYPH